MTVLRMPRAHRRCGTRKVGGTYLVFEGTCRVCPRLPMELPPACPSCGTKMEFFRSIKIINPRHMFGEIEGTGCGESCAACHPPETGGVMWVGEKYYPTPEDFICEGQRMGISKKIPPNIPKGIKIGDWFFFLHKKAVQKETKDEHGKLTGTTQEPGVFFIAKLTQIHRIVTEAQARDKKFVQDLEDQGITAVVEYDEPGDTGQKVLCE